MFVWKSICFVITMHSFIWAIKSASNKVFCNIIIHLQNYDVYGLHFHNFYILIVQQELRAVNVAVFIADVLLDSGCHCAGHVKELDGGYIIFGP